MLNITKTNEDNKLNVAVEGRLDTTTAPELEAALKEDIANVSELVIDLSSLEYISSAGLRVLLAAQKIMMKQGKTLIQLLQFSKYLKSPVSAISSQSSNTGFSDHPF